MIKRRHIWLQKNSTSPLQLSFVGKKLGDNILSKTYKEFKKEKAYSLIRMELTPMYHESKF